MWFPDLRGGWDDKNRWISGLSLIILTKKKSGKRFWVVKNVEISIQNWDILKYGLYFWLDGLNGLCFINLSQVRYLQTEKHNKKYTYRKPTHCSITDESTYTIWLLDCLLTTGYVWLDCVSRVFRGIKRFCVCNPNFRFSSWCFNNSIFRGHDVYKGLQMI